MLASSRTGIRTSLGTSTSLLTLTVHDTTVHALPKPVAAQPNVSTWATVGTPGTDNYATAGQPTHTITARAGEPT